MSVSTRIGLRGGRATAHVDTAGVVHLELQSRGWRRALRQAGEQRQLGWWVAAEDRWHDPRAEASVRQRLIDGTPVVETKVAVPGGDIVQRVYVVADHEGCVVMEVANASRSAVAVAVPTRALSTTAATLPTAPQGIELPDEVRAFALSHGSEVRFVWRSDGTDSPGEIDRVADAAAVVRGWVSACERASRISLGATELVAARSALLLATSHEVDDLLQRDAARGLLTIAERVRMGESPMPFIDQIADAARRVLRSPNDGWASRALIMAARVLAKADEVQASHDVAAAWAEIAADGVVASTESIEPLSRAVDLVVRAEDLLVRAVNANEAAVFAEGIPAGWRGVNFEAHALPAGPMHTVSLALRWHGENAALLWEIDGPPGLRLAAPRVDSTFVTSEQRGEGLLKVRA